MCRFQLATRRAADKGPGPGSLAHGLRLPRHALLVGGPEWSVEHVHPVHVVGQQVGEPLHEGGPLQHHGLLLCQAGVRLPQSLPQGRRHEVQLAHPHEQSEHGGMDGLGEDETDAIAPRLRIIGRLFSVQMSHYVQECGEQVLPGVSVRRAHACQQLVEPEDSPAGGDQLLRIPLSLPFPLPLRGEQQEATAVSDEETQVLLNADASTGLVPRLGAVGYGPDHVVAEVAGPRVVGAGGEREERLLPAPRLLPALLDLEEGGRAEPSAQIGRVLLLGGVRMHRTEDLLRVVVSSVRVQGAEGGAEVLCRQQRLLGEGAAVVEEGPGIPRGVRGLRGTGGVYGGEGRPEEVREQMVL